MCLIRFLRTVGLLSNVSCEASIRMYLIISVYFLLQPILSALSYHILRSRLLFMALKSPGFSILAHP